MTLPKREQAPPTMPLGPNQIGAYAADLLDLEEQIEALQTGKRDLYKSIREDHGKSDAAALKAAVKLARMGDEERDARDNIDAEALRMLAIIEASPAPRATRLSASGVPDGNQPVQVADQSTAARMDVPEVTRSGKLGIVISEDSALAAPELTDERMPGSQDPKPESGNQAPPVDTLSEFGVRNNVAQPPRTNTPVPDAGAKVATHSDPASAGAAAATDEATPSPQPPASSVVAPSNVTQLRPEKRITFNDKPHVDCLDPGQCGGFSNLGLCPRCKAVVGGGAAEIEHHGSVA